MGSSCLLFKALFTALVVAGFMCLFLIGSLESGGNSTTPLTTKSRQNLKYAEALDRAKFIDHPNLDLNYMMSKRRVPNGPDPIHNRRAGNSRRPPGQS